METTKKVRRVSKWKSRGAALVEGSLLFPVMVMFLPYMAYFHNIHKSEFVNMGKTRAEVWAYTSKSCTGAGTAGPNQTATTETSSGKGGPADNAPIASNVRNGLIATGYATTTTQADAAPFNVKFTLKHPVKAESWNFCNEIKYDVETKSLIGQMADLGKQIAKTF